MSTNALTQNIAGLFGDYKAEGGLPWSFKVAPVIYQDSETGAYNVLQSSKFADLRDLPSAGSSRAPFRPVELAYTKVSTQIAIYKGKAVKLDDRIVRMLEAENPSLDLMRDAMETVLPDIWQAHIAATHTAIASLTAAPTATWDLTNQATEIPKLVRDTKRAIRTATGKAPTHILLSEEAIDRLCMNDFIYQGVAIAGAGGSGQTFRRTDTITPDDVIAYFRDKLGLGVIKNDTIVIGTGGSNELNSQTVGAMLHVAPGEQDSCIKTFAQTTDRSGDIVDFYTDRAVLPDTPGTYVAADAAFEVKVVSSGYGRKFTTTV